MSLRAWLIYLAVIDIAALFGIYYVVVAAIMLALAYRLMINDEQENDLDE